MATAGGGFKLPGGCQWLYAAANRLPNGPNLTTLQFIKKKSSEFGRDAENTWMNFFFPPIAGPLSNHPTWIPNWVPLQLAVYLPSLRARIALNNGTNAANRTAFINAAKQEAQTNQVWAKFRAGTSRVVVQVAVVPGYAPTTPL